MRYSRQELKQDKFANTLAETAGDAVHWSVEHRNKLIAGAVAAVVVILIGLGIFWYSEHREQLASTELGNALVTYNAPLVPPGTPKQGSVTTFESSQQRAIAAKNAFYAVSSKYGATSSGQYARYLAGLTENELGNYKVAEDQLRAISNSRRKNLAALARLALASTYREEGKEQDAVNTLQGLIDRPTESVPKANAQFALADIYEAKQPDKARAIYDQIAKENPKSSIGQIANMHKEQLK